MAEGPSKKRANRELSICDDLDTIRVPKELVTPLKELIAKLCHQIGTQDVPTSFATLKNFTGAVEDIPVNKSITMDKFRHFKSALHNNLKAFQRQEVYADLDQSSYDKFKTVRKNLTRWFKLGDSCSKRTENPYDNAHQLVQCTVNVSQSIASREVSNSIKSFFDGKRIEVENALETTLLDELLGISSDLADEFAACSERTDKLIWAKAFRAVLANNKSRPSYHSDNTKFSTPESNRSVSFAPSTSGGESSHSNKSRHKGKSILKKSSRHPREVFSSGSDDSLESGEENVPQHKSTRNSRNSFRPYRGKHY
jgi:hypothetical protein